MKVYTDNPNFVDRMLSGVHWHFCDASATPQELRHLIDAVFEKRPIHHADVPSKLSWKHLLVSERSSRSQYDLLIEQRRQGQRVPDGVLCLTGAGSGLHGFRQRPWAAEAGNIHLSVHLAPGRLAADSGLSFMVLAAVSVVDAIDSISGLTAAAAIKWVNDILIDNAKVGGVLAYTEGVGKSVDAAVLGIGINVETTPTVEATPFVPRVGSLREFSCGGAAVSQGLVLEALLAALDRNYQLLMKGRARELVGRYRERSLVLGMDVTVYVDDDTVSSPQTIARGTVEKIGENLELIIAGHDTPVSRGRLVFNAMT